MEVREDEKRFEGQHTRDKDFRGNHSNHGCSSAAAAETVRFDVHDFAEHMGVHREQRAKKHGRPAELRCVIQPTAENKYEQIARLVQDIEWRLALETVERNIIDSSKGDQRCEPEQNLGAFEIPENSKEDRLHESNSRR